MPKPIEPLNLRLERLTDKTGECWLWTGSVDAYGYGQLSFGHSKKLKAHRVAWELVNGAIPAGMGVLHRCDTPRCVRTEHLFLGDQAANIRDCADKGRVRSKYPVLRGEQNPQSRLTDEQRSAIRSSTATQRVLSEQYGVSQGTICRVRSSVGSSKRTARRRTVTEARAVLPSNE